MELSKKDFLVLADMLTQRYRFFHLDGKKYYNLNHRDIAKKIYRDKLYISKWRAATSLLAIVSNTPEHWLHDIMNCEIENVPIYLEHPLSAVKLAARWRIKILK